VKHLEEVIINYDKKLMEANIEIQRLNNIIKEIREILNNKREISVTQLLDRGYCDYEELLYQVDEEIKKVLDKVLDIGDSNDN